MLAIDRALHPHTGGGTPLKIMTLLRLSPLVPFSPLNYLMYVRPPTTIPPPPNIPHHQPPQNLQTPNPPKNNRSITSLSLRDYTLGLGGMVPATLAYVFLGTTSGSLAAESASGQTTTASKHDKALRIVLYALGAASLVLAVALLSAHARRELRRLAPEEGGEEGSGVLEAGAGAGAAVVEVGGDGDGRGGVGVGEGRRAAQGAVLP